MSAPEPALRLDGVGKEFGRLEVLRNIDLQVARGELVVLVGPSGCGKTTLLRTIIELLAPDTGRVTRVAEIAPTEVGVVFQDDVLLPWADVGENVALPLTVRGVERARARARAEEALDRLGIGAWATERPSRLSGGRRQQVALARALVAGPKLLVLDEPFGHLDPLTRTDIERGLLTEVEALRAATVFVTHNIEEAVYLADRVVVLTSKPSTVKTEVVIDLPHPRETDHPRLVDLRRRLTDLVRWW